MDIRNSLDGLKNLLGVTSPTSSAAPRVKSGQAAESSSISSDRATLSSAGSAMAMNAADGGVRLDKVASIQSALAAGTYNVPAAAVADSLVNSMLASSN
ncbi:MAG TPA: flagellar biosynthesis anti-sigma factor FlgM [Terracidiphilus sp.]|jgi:negative regulator of flagellin synthesis FlgM